MEYALRKTLALADAELSAAEVPALVQELARNPSLVRALQVYIAVGRRRIAKPYAAKRDEPVPQWLVDTVMRTPMERAADRSASVVSFGSKLLERMRSRYHTPGWAVAGPALAAVLALFVWQQATGAATGGLLMTAKLQNALERTASGEDPSLTRFQAAADLLEPRSSLVPPVRDAIQRGAHFWRCLPRRRRALAARDADTARSGRHAAGWQPAPTPRRLCRHQDERATARNRASGGRHEVRLAAAGRQMRT